MSTESPGLRAGPTGTSSTPAARVADPEPASAPATTRQPAVADGAPSTAVPTSDSPTSGSAAAGDGDDQRSGDDRRDDAIGRRVEERPGRVKASKRKAPPRRKRKVRKVHRVVRHVEVWSVAKVTAVFVACGYLVAMISGYLLWRAADRVGTIDGIEGFMEDSGGYDTYQILGDVVFRVAAISLAVLAFVAVALVVLAAVLFNLISDVTGGIRMTVIDEDLIVAPARRRPTDASGPNRPGSNGPGTNGPPRRPEASG